MIVQAHELRVKRTPYGRIQIYELYEGVEFVLTSDVYKLAHRYAKANNWTQDEIATIGGSFPF